MSTELLITTADELLEMPADGCRYELVDGVLRKMSPAGAEHGAITSVLHWHLTAHVRTNGLGTTYSSDTGFKIASEPDSVLAPDVSFVAKDRTLAIRDIRKFVPFAPDLAIEVLSPSDSYSETVEKIEAWLAAGTRAVILVDPRLKTVAIHRSPTKQEVLTEKDALKVPEVVPGWSMAVAEIFATD